VILYPIVSKKDISLFIKVNSYGVIFICITVVFILSYGFYSFTDTNFIISNADNDYESNVRNISLFRNKFSSLAGMMSLGYFLHNISLSIVRENRYPENNQRDLFMGYFLVFLSNCLVGTLGYLGFSGASFTISIRDTQNLLYMFKATDILAFLIRIT
jgi:sodium-coupled neutral amino acid transporter 9